VSDVTTLKDPETEAQTIDARKQRLLNETLMIREAVAYAIDEHRRLGHPIVIARDGKVLWLQPGEY
jgi:hypothetical protein